MLQDIGICHFYEYSAPAQDCKLKEEIEDFIVHEINGVEICEFAPVLDFAQFKASEEAYANLPDVTTKEDRKKVYDSVRHYPFKRLKTVDGAFATEETSKDIFVCTLMKYNLNTVDAVHILSKRLGISPRNIQFGGNKDKRGVTFQEISLDCSFEALFNYALSASKNAQLNDPQYGYSTGIAEANMKLEQEMASFMAVKITECADRLMLFNIRKGHAKKLGDNDGNKFKIRLRGITAIPTIPRHFLNYYGMQRFGRNFNNHLIGQCILEERYDDAIQLIMADGRAQGCPGEDAAEAEAVDEKDAQSSLSSVQRHIARMKRSKAKSSFIVHSLDRMSKMMYMHAYQSYKFNCAINERWEDKKPQSDDALPIDGGFVECDGEGDLMDVYIPLEKGRSKFLKGGYRKMIEEIGNFSYAAEEGAVVIEFCLKKSCYATCAIREVVGDII